jgi:hypothetical protein
VGPTCQWRERGERELAGRLVVWAALIWAAQKKRKDGLGCEVVCLSFFSFLFFSIPFLPFLFQTFTQNLFKILNQLLTTQSIQNPCIQHDAQLLGFSKLINYHCIYLKANLIIQIH